MYLKKWIIIIFLGASGPMNASPVFTYEPREEPYFVHNGDNELKLPCSIRSQYFDQKKYDISWTRYFNNQLRVITKNDKVLVKKKPSYVLDYNAQRGDYDLIMTEIGNNGVEGIYHCNVIATDDSEMQNSTSVTVVILIPPGDPIINAVFTENVIEGDVVSVKCLSQGGSPQPTVKWKFPNGTEAYSHTTYSNDGVTESLLHFRITANDNGKFIQCDVTNEAMAEGEFKTATSSQLNVLYKPSVFVTPSENMTHLSVEEGSLVNLTCHSRSNPPAHSFEWKHLSSGERYHGRIWPIVANTSMTGDFECRSTNELGEGTAVLNFVVQYGPRIDLPVSIEPMQSTDINMECKAKALPEVMEVRWIGPHGFKLNGSNLIIKSITKEQTGNYTCIANNFLTVYGQSGSQSRINTKTMLINVKRKPGVARIISLRNKFDFGETISLKCSSQDSGNPTASYIWSSPLSSGIYGLEAHTNHTFSIRNAQLSDNGVYSCKAANYIGEGQAAFINITIIEKASISNPLPTEKVFTSGDYNKTLECEAEGYPTPIISWLKNGLAFSSNVTDLIYESKCNSGDFCTQKIKSTLSFEGPLKWSDKGNFTCIADNGSSKRDKLGSSWTIVRILHKPVILKNKFSKKTLAAAEVNTQSTIICKVSGRPEPVFQWYRNGSEIVEDAKYSIHNLPSNGRPDHYEQILQIENVGDDDFGEYVCRTTNSHGEDDLVIDLRRASPPGVPGNFRKLSASSASILVSWIPQFDGGFQQTFVLEAKKMNPFTGDMEENMSTTVLSLTDVQYDEKYENDGTVKSRILFNYTGLTPLSTFNLRLKAENKKGTSDFTEVLVASTDDVSEDETMMHPNRLIYNFTNKKFSVEPKLPMDACTLFYVFHDGAWRTTNCYATTSLISDISKQNTYKARFCTLSNKLKCSPFSEQVSIGFENTWKTSIMVPFIFFCFIGLSVCVFFAVCCKTRSTPNNSKLVPLVFPSLSTVGESKKTLNYHKSFDNSDTSVTFENGNKSKAEENIISFDENRLHYENTNSNHLPDASNLTNSPALSFKVSGAQNGGSLENNSEDDERRVVREIIV